MAVYNKADQLRVVDIDYICSTASEKNILLAGVEGVKQKWGINKRVDGEKGKKKGGKKENKRMNFHRHGRVSLEQAFSGTKYASKNGELIGTYQDGDLSYHEGKIRHIVIFSRKLDPSTPIRQKNCRAKVASE